MIAVPANTNSVLVGMVRTGCCQSQFSSVYPNRLVGIISQDEFRESINNINTKMGSNKLPMFCFVFFILCPVAGLGLTVAGRHRYSNASVALLIIGNILVGLVPSLAIIGICIIRIRRTTKMRQAIAEESKKYSTRSPVACTWQLNVNTIRTGSGSNYHVVQVYHVIIDIHRSRASRVSRPTQTVRPQGNIRPPPHPGPGSANLHPNQSTSWPTSAVQPQDDTLPPPYPGPPVECCSQCGAQKSESTAKFCSACGHQF